MKTKRRKLSVYEGMCILAPFAVLWLFLGLFIHPAIFKFWVAGQSIGTVEAMTLGFTPIVFTLIYAPSMFIVYKRGAPITLPKTMAFALVAAVTGLVMSPLP